MSGSKAQTKMVAHLIEPKCSDKIQNNELIKKTKIPNRARVCGSKSKQKVFIARMRTNTVFSNSEPLSLGELLQVHSHWRAM